MNTYEKALNERVTLAEIEAGATINETKKAEIMAIVNEICADNSTDCRGLSLSSMASDLLDALGIDPYLDIFEIPVHSDGQVCICFWFNGEPFELWVGLSYETKEFFIDCRRWSEDANGEIVDFSMFAKKSSQAAKKIMENYNNELHEIFTNILRGGVYGRTASGPRWAYFSEALYLINSAGDPFIGWCNFGSSANKCDLDNLLWIIETIFKTTPRDFLKEYECRF